MSNLPLKIGRISLRLPGAPFGTVSTSFSVSTAAPSLFTTLATAVAGGDGASFRAGARLNPPAKHFSCSQGGTVRPSRPRIVACRSAKFMRRRERPGERPGARIIAGTRKPPSVVSPVSPGMISGLKRDFLLPPLARFGILGPKWLS